jgi:hypothetical protein
MSSWSKILFMLAASCLLWGCATGGNESGTGSAGDQSASTQMAANSCMSQATSARQECEQKCPKATGSEHFSMQHKLAMEYAACTERCSGKMESEAMRCKVSS